MQKSLRRKNCRSTIGRYGKRANPKAGSEGIVMFYHMEGFNSIAMTPIIDDIFSLITSETKETSPSNRLEIIAAGPINIVNTIVLGIDKITPNISNISNDLLS